MADPARHKLRWYQFSLRSLFVMMTLFGVGCSWYAYEMDKAAKRRAAIAEITKLGGSVYYFNPNHSEYTGGTPRKWYSWLRRLHGDEQLGILVCVNLTSEEITDADLVHLEVLTTLEDLRLGRTQVSDAGMVHLKCLTALRGLELDHTQISDAGLEHLKGLRKLRYLDLQDTRITDAGLEHLKGLSELYSIDLCQTDVTYEGAKKFEKLLPDRHCRAP